MEDLDLKLLKIQMPTEEELEASAHNWYQHMRSDNNNFSYWFPRIQNCGIKVPKSWFRILTFDEWQNLTKDCESNFPAVYEFVQREIFPHLISDEFSTIFMKNGTFSDKFNFSVCATGYSIPAIAINLQTLMMDSLMFDTHGDTELVFREKIPSSPDALTIYNGMPLQAEFRVFYDFDKKKIAYSVNYWDWDYCNDSISYNKTDAIVYQAAYPQLFETFKLHQNEVEQMVAAAMTNVDMSGQWSIDILYNGEDFWLIDMAEARSSAYYDSDKFKQLTNE